MFKKKQSLLVSRPRPPAFSEVVEDVGAVNEDDCVFHFIKALSEDSGTEEKELLKPIQEQNINVADHDLREDERMTSEVEAAYQRVHQFISMMEELKSAPQTLHNLYEHLKIGDRNLQDSVNSLRRNVDTFKHLGSNVTETN